MQSNQSQFVLFRGVKMMPTIKDRRAKLLDVFNKVYPMLYIIENASFS